MFRVFGNLAPSRGGDARGGNAGGRTHDAGLEPVLPPFRSAGRSMALSWEDVSLSFVSNDDMDHAPVGEGEGERALGEAARLWDEDRVDAGGGAHAEEDGEEADAEMDRLEEYVVTSLAEDEAEERARREDGIPSMTSAPPSSRRDPRHDWAGEDPPVDGSPPEEEPLPFPLRSEEVLEELSDAAFALTALPTSPWLLRFRHTLDCATDGMYHEMLCNPSVVILAASTSEPSYADSLAELANVHHLPRPYHDGRYDPNGLRREFLLIHDVVHGPRDFDESRALKRMRDRFGAGCCSVLRVNSLVPRHVAISDGYATAGEDARWEGSGPASPFVSSIDGAVLSEKYAARDPDGRPVRGACLSPSDKRAIRRYVANMVATGLVPAIERRIAHLNSSVSNAKRGMKNVIKSFWRKPKENLLTNVSNYSGEGGGGGAGGGRRDGGDHGAAEAGSAGIVKYRHDSIESQTRLLADTLFLMRDYEAALSAYRLVKDDYKHDRAHLHYASVHEMIVLCMHMLDPSGRDGRFAGEVQHSIETALYSYTRVSDEDEQREGGGDGGAGTARPGRAPHATRLATRLCLALSSARGLCDRRHVEVADLLASASSHETPLGAAVLLEQSAAHYRRAGMARKFAFHMLMAGHMFRGSAGGQGRHAFRCFAASLHVYRGERWGELRSHLRSALAAQLYGMGRFALGAQFYAKLIGMRGGGRVSVRSQQKFLNHIVSVCRDHPREALVAIDRMNSSHDNAAARNGGAIEDVLKGFTDAVVRQIEVSNIGFPHVQDSSLRICVDSTENEDGNVVDNSFIFYGRSDSVPIVTDGGAITPNGPTSGKGDEAVWQDMINCTDAELRCAAAGGSSSSKDNERSSQDNGNPADPMRPPPDAGGESTVARVVSAIDAEGRGAGHRERSRRKGGARSPEVRSTREPLVVSFRLRNPLGLDVELADAQLVASLARAAPGPAHTNEFPIAPSREGEGEAPDEDRKKSWSFHGSDDEFRCPEFLCQLPADGDAGDSDSSFGVPSSRASPSSRAVDGHSSDPFFVVTKPLVKMGPNADVVVSLKICPLAEGDLRIRGFRFRLSGEVWIYHRFDLVGPLLQDTSANRSRRVREESLLLRSKVEQEMPSLKVTITPDDESTVTQNGTTVLQGQTSRWKLTLSNLGYASASNIVLKTNAPWLNMAPPRSDDEDTATEETNEIEENAPTSHCVGPSGTLMRVPLSRDGADGDRPPPSDVLRPGETVEVPIAVRTSGGGRQEFYMLFRYELGSSAASTTASNGAGGAAAAHPRHRWARKLLSLPVYPSITMSASLMPSYSNKGEHILSVELMNYRSDRDSKLEIYLNKICVASRNFEIRQLQGQVDSEDLSHSLVSKNDGSSSSSNPVSSPSLKIGWQERVTLHYLVVPIERANTYVTFSTLLFSRGMASDSSSGTSRRCGAQVTDFMCRERAHEVFISALHSHRIEEERIAAEQEKKGQPRHVSQIRRAKTSLPEQESIVLSSAASDGQQSQVSNLAAPPVAAHPTSLASLCPLSGGSNINIICCWSAFVGNKGRDITIQGQHHLRDLLVRPLNKSKGCPLALTAKYKPRVSHNFAKGPLVEDVEITIRNRLIETEVEFEFAIIDHSEFDFVGTTCFNWSLSGGDEISVPLEARIYSGGVYNLQSVRLTVLKAGAMAVPYLFPLQWTMVVDDSA